MKAINWILITCAIAIGVARGSRLFHTSHPNPDAGTPTPDAGTPKRRRTPPYKDAYGPRSFVGSDRLYFDDLIPREEWRPSMPLIDPAGPHGPWASPMPLVFPVLPETYGIIFWPRLDAGYEENGVFLPSGSRCAPIDGGYFCRRPI